MVSWFFTQHVKIVDSRNSTENNVEDDKNKNLANKKLSVNIYILLIISSSHFQSIYFNIDYQSKWISTNCEITFDVEPFYAFTAWTENL